MGNVTGFARTKRVFVVGKDTGFVKSGEEQFLKEEKYAENGKIKPSINLFTLMITNFFLTVQPNVKKECKMAYKKNDKVLLTASVLRKNPKSGKPETLNLVDELGTIKKVQLYKKQPEKNQYHVETKYGVTFVNESKLAPKT